MFLIYFVKSSVKAVETNVYARTLSSQLSNIR
jgi:hypothetical protein